MVSKLKPINYICLTAYFLNKVLLEYSPTDSFTYSLKLLWSYKIRVGCVDRDHMLTKPVISYQAFYWKSLLIPVIETNWEWSDKLDRILREDLS